MPYLFCYYVQKGLGAPQMVVFGVRMFNKCVYIF